MKSSSLHRKKSRQGQKTFLPFGVIPPIPENSERPMPKANLIPISDESLEDCYYKAGKDLISIYANNHPDNQLFPQ